MVKTLLVSAALALCCTAFAANRELTAKDIAQIKQICRALAGAKAAPAKSDPIFERLAPYVRHEMTLPGLHVVCDKRCGGLINLLGDADIYFSYPNTADGHSRIDTVVFRKDGKVLLSIGSDGARKPSNQSMQPTAGRSGAKL
jgi:hypothetical protein